MTYSRHNYSRLQNRYEKTTKKQSIILIFSSIVILILFVMYGFPAILNLSGTIGNLRGNKTSTNSANLGPIPATPRFSQDFDATKSAQITLKGVADSKVSVEIFQNDRSLEIVTSKDDGTFSLETDLFRGDNVFVAQAVSDTGQKSEKSDGYKISYLTSAPKLEITSPNDGDNLKDNPVTITGKTDPNTNVTVNDRLAIVSGDGGFSYSFNLSNGDNKIKIAATDRAGNQSTKEITVKYNP